MPCEEQGEHNVTLNFLMALLGNFQTARVRMNQTRSACMLDQSPGANFLLEPFDNV
jgi:hypothetical protein